MIIYGSRMYGTKNVVHGHGECPHCGVYTKHKSYQGKKFGHLYFIPLIPMGGTVRVMRECSGCNMGAHVPVAQVAVMYRRIETLMQHCVLAASEGKRVFNDPETGETHNGPFLIEAVDLLYTGGYRNEVPELIGLFDNEAARYEHGIARGAYAEIRGDGQAAYSAYLSSSEAAPDEPLAYLMMADIELRAGKPEQALVLIEKVESILPDDVQVLIAKMGPLEAMGRFEALADVMDRAIELAPELGQDRKFMKVRKKIGKKAAKQAR